MQYRTLGRTTLTVSLAGLGTGGPARIGQSRGLSTAESHALIRTAYDLGINLFDTSPAYGHSESLLGGGLAGLPRDGYVLATKFPPYEGGELKPAEAFEAQLDASLRALRVDYVDVLQYHGVRPGTYRQVLDRFQDLAERARTQGKVRYLGITETGADDAAHDMLAMALADDLFDTLMVKHGILNQAAFARVLPMAVERNVGVFVMASVRRSLRTPEEAVETLAHMSREGLLEGPLPDAEDPLRLGMVGEEVPSLTRAAYQFAAQSEGVSTVLVGTGNVHHLRQNVADLNAPPLSKAQIAHLRRAFGHLAWES